VPGNHHGKGWNTPILPVSKGSPGWRKKISLQSTTNARTGDTLHRDEQHSTVEDEVTEFDSSSDEESCAGEDLLEEESILGNLQITRDVDFLTGATSRFGGSVQLNSRIVFWVKPEPGDQLPLRNGQYVSLLTVTFTCAGTDD